MAPQIGDEEVKEEQMENENGNAGTRKHGRTAPDWRDEDIVLPVGPNNVEKIRQRHGVQDGGGATVNFIYFRCRHRSAGCKFTMRWAKPGGLLQSRGHHNNHGHAQAVKAPVKKQVKVKAPVKKRAPVEWDDEEIVKPVGPVNVEKIKQRHGVINAGGSNSKTASYFRCRHYSAGCKFTMRWTKQGGLLQSRGEHSHHYHGHAQAVKAPVKKQAAVEWDEEEIVLPILPVNEKKIKQRHGVTDAGGVSGNFIYFRCRHYHAGCKFRMRWAKPGGLLQSRGYHSHHGHAQAQAVNVKAPAKKQVKAEWRKVCAKGGVRQICADHGVCQINNGSSEEVHFCCKEPRCPLRVKWLLEDSSVWTMGKHEQH